LLGDHDLITKAVCYEASVRVPAMLVPPRGTPRSRPIREELIQGIDLAVSILDLAGADTHGLAGRSLLGADRTERDAVFSQIATFSMVRTEEWKLIVDTPTLEPQACYRLSTDPDERRDLVDDPATAPVIRQLTDRYLRDYARGVVPMG
jgi:arylsulfatase A-like enzyme